jgi:hypothetical protein
MRNRIILLLGKITKFYYNKVKSFMSFKFLDPSDISKRMFYKCVNIIIEKDSLQIHMLNETVLLEYGKNINDFLSYLIKVGENLEEYEMCSQLIIQQKQYRKWLRVNLETVHSISKLLKDLSDYDNAKNK